MGVRAAAAIALLASGAALADVAEAKLIEDIRAGDYVLSRDQDDSDARLTFQRVEALVVGYYDEIHWLTLTDLLTGNSETIGTARHPFWVTDLGPQNPLAPLADVEQPHNGAAGATYAHSLSDITDRHLDSRVVKQGWVLTLADGRRIVVESARLTAEALRAASADAPITRIEPVILGSAGWVASCDIPAGGWVAGARPLGLRVDAVRVERGRVWTYNLKVEGSHTYFVGCLAAWVHNQSLTPGQALRGILNDAKAAGGSAEEVAGNIRKGFQGMEQQFEGWKFVETTAEDGSKVFSGAMGEAIVVDSSGKIFRGNLNNIKQFGVDDVTGGVIPRYDGLTEWKNP